MTIGIMNLTATLEQVFPLMMDLSVLGFYGFAIVISSKKNSSALLQLTILLARFGAECSWAGNIVCCKELPNPTQWMFHLCESPHSKRPILPLTDESLIRSMETKTQRYCLALCCNDTDTYIPEKKEGRPDRHFLSLALHVLVAAKLEPSSSSSRNSSRSIATEPL